MRIFLSNSSTKTYTYDALGRRVSKTVSGTVTDFLRDGDDEIAEYSGAGALQRRFVPGPAIDDLIAMVTSAGVKTFFQTNHQGSVVAMSDTSGNLAEGPYTYDPFGTPNTTAGEPFRFTGQYLDAESGLYYYRSRMYAPGQGRFFQTDTVGYDPDPNWYIYVGNDPTDKDDPTGMAFGLDDAAGIVVGGLIGVGVEVGKDYFTGQPITRGEVAGAFVGGALMGEGVANAPETGGASVVAAGAARGAVVGFVSNSVQQATDIASGDQKGYSVTSAAVSTGVGAVTGGVLTKVGTVEVPGISSGRNSMSAVAKAVKTKIENGNASNMSAKTVVKGAVGGQVGNAGRTAVGAGIDTAKTKVCQKTNADC